MIWPEDVSFDGYCKKVSVWYDNPEHFIGDPPISAQYALDLIFKTLIDDKEHYEFLCVYFKPFKQFVMFGFVGKVAIQNQVYC